MRVIDGDGHVCEDSEAIGRYLPGDFTRPRSTPDRWFPPLDRFHSFIGQTPPGSFQQVGPDGWLEFMADVGIETAVLYPTHGLAYGNVFHLDWAIALGRAYNDWLAETYLRRSPRFQGMALIPMQEPEAAVVELRRAVELDALRTFLSERLAAFKVPERIEIVDAVPRDPNGKVRKRQLAREFTQDRG